MALAVFLVDRLELEDQAGKKPTSPLLLLSADFKTVIYKENRDDWRRAEIVVTTVQSLLFNNKYQRLFSPTDFDFVVSDEAHRSIFNRFTEVIEYFDARMVGLTATPANFIDRDTFRTFACTAASSTLSVPTTLLST